jgi:hypothetical protein
MVDPKAIFTTLGEMYERPEVLKLGRRELARMG